MGLVGHPVLPFSLALQLEAAHTRPVWPSGPEDQQIRAYLGHAVDGLDVAVAYEVGAGVTLAEFQPQKKRLGADRSCEASVLSAGGLARLPDREPLSAPARWRRVRRPPRPTRRRDGDQPASHGDQQHAQQQGGSKPRGPTGLSHRWAAPDIGPTLGWAASAGTGAPGWATGRPLPDCIGKAALRSLSANSSAFRASPSRTMLRSARSQDIREVTAALGPLVLAQPCAVEDSAFERQA